MNFLDEIGIDKTLLLVLNFKLAMISMLHLPVKYIVCQLRATEMICNKIVILCHIELL